MNPQDKHTSTRHSFHASLGLSLVIVIATSIFAIILFTLKDISGESELYPRPLSEQNTNKLSEDVVAKSMQAKSARSAGNKEALGNLSDFTFIVIPDTQKYAKRHPDTFCTQTNWIATERYKRNILFALHVGDIVDSYSSSAAEWEVASKCMAQLDGLVPYGIVPGNHDVDHRLREDGKSYYDKYFPGTRYKGQPWYGGNFKNNHNSYQIIDTKTDVGKILFIGLEIEPSDEAIAWANQIIKKHPETYTVIFTHKYLPDTGSKLDTERRYSKSGNTGEEIWKKLVRNNCQVKMVLNGHYHGKDGENMLISKNNCGNEVHQIVQNYQARENGGDGKLRIYTFNLDQKQILVQTYSPKLNTYETDEDSKFTTPLTI